ncbi:MAG: hypothetical protein H6Q00_2623 [Holophagaceae bacterium]|nr:hypothetical protein [Holophagaceae bacterium]
MSRNVLIAGFMGLLLGVQPAVAGAPADLVVCNGAV